MAWKKKAPPPTPPPMRERPPVPGSGTFRAYRPGSSDAATQSNGSQPAYPGERTADTAGPVDNDAATQGGLNSSGSASVGTVQGALPEQSGSDAFRPVDGRDATALGRDVAAVYRAVSGLANILDAVFSHTDPQPSDREAMRRLEPEMQRALGLIHELLERSAVGPEDAEATDSGHGAASAAPGPASVDVPAMRCNLHGTMESMPLAGVLQMLGRASKTGLLRVQTAQSSLSFRLHEGRLIQSEGLGQAGPRLGELLVERSVITEEALSEVLEGLSPGEHLGETLEASGMVDRDTIIETLAEQMSRRVTQAMEAGDAEWWFYEVDEGEFDGRIDIDVMPLLLGQLGWS